MAAFDAIKALRKKKLQEKAQNSAHLSALPSESSATSPSSSFALGNFQRRNEAWEAYRVGEIPTAYYIAEAITAYDEDAILSQINRSNDTWTEVSGRRLQLYENNDTVSFPPWLKELSDKLKEAKLFPDVLLPSHVLINNYSSHEGILHHTDGPAYYPVVAILSLETTILMSFRRNLSTSQIGIEFGGDIFTVALQPRSLFVFQEDLYSEHLHGISADPKSQTVGLNDLPCINAQIAGIDPGVECCWTSRTSLTFRMKR